jgi:hypothetical protein
LEENNIRNVEQLETTPNPMVVYIDNNTSIYDNHRKLMEK